MLQDLSPDDHDLAAKIRQIEDEARRITGQARQEEATKGLLNAKKERIRALLQPRQKTSMNLKGW